MARFPAGRSFVQAALDGVGRAGLAAVDMRHFAARDAMPAEYCRARVVQCEVYVAVVGFRYGSLVPGEEVSYTEMEFQAASSAGLPRLVFLLEGDGLPGPAGADREMADGFRQRLGEAGLVVRTFTTSDGLELEVFHALSEMASGGPRSAPPAMKTLPQDVTAFTGRDTELRQLIAAAGSAGVVAIHTVDGMPGVGKTALVTRAAHLLKDAFPDGQLFVHLHAHTPGREPVAPGDALAGLLTAAGVDPRFLPGDLDGRAAMWRDRMAGQRTVLVLDNAASSDQVAPLLPGSRDCLVLVTSRRHLGDLPGPVVPLVLDVLPAEQAAEMFTRLAPRAAADLATVAEMVRLAGFLPLAVSLLARVFARHPSWTLADLADDTRARLLTLKAENSSVAAAFELSYRHLGPSLRRIFALLGLHPGGTTDSYAAAALVGTSPAKASELLDALHAEGLLTETSYRRYGMHDLLRRYARDHAATDPDHGQALGRLLDYYQHAAALAQDRLARQTRPGSPPATPTPPPAAPALGDAAEALAWARAERDNLLACLDHATRTGQHARITALTAALAGLLRYDGSWTEAITRHTTAIQAARQLADQPAEANALTNLGDMQRLTGDYPGAAQALEQALDIYRNIGDRLGLANALTTLGDVARLTGDYPGAAQALEQALDIYCNIGDRLGLANALTNLGVVRRLTGDYPGAAQALEQALDIYRDLGNRGGEAVTLNEEGTLRRASGELSRAEKCHQQALELARTITSSWNEAHALAGLGRCAIAAGHIAQAEVPLRQAHQIFQEIGAADAPALLAELNALISPGPGK